VRVINRKFLRNIEKLLEVIDRRPYERNDYHVFILDAIQYVANLREQGSNNLNYIKQALGQSDLDQSFINDLYSNLEINMHDLSKEEYDHLSRVIRDYVDYVHVFEVRPDLISTVDELMNPPSGRPSSDVMKKLKELLERTLSNIRIADVTRDDEQTVCIDSQEPVKVKGEVLALHEELTDPSNIFVTGIKELNRFLNGGFERKRTYIFYAPTNSYKSIMLLYCCLWILKYNRQMKPRFPNKRLAVILITNENSKGETMDRLHALETNGYIDPTQLSSDVYWGQWEDILHRMNSNFKLYIVYKNSINTTSEDIKATVEAIEEDDGVEIAAVVIDHLGNIKKLDKSVDDRKGLINSAYELSHWGKTTNRAIITAMHTNSDFDAKIAEYRDSGKTNLVRYSGNHAISEAKYIEKAVDQSIFLLKEQSAVDGEMYLGFKYEKMRKRRSLGSNVFYHRLINGLCLLDDVYTDTQHSIPCMPGTENGLIARGRQMEPQYRQMQQGGTLPYNQQATPFTQTMMPRPQNGGWNQQQRYAPVQIALNQGIGLDLSQNQQTYEDVEINEQGVDDFYDIIEAAENGILETNFEGIDDLTDDDFNTEDDPIPEEI
jgi:hypothetical protein